MFLIGIGEQPRLHRPLAAAAGSNANRRWKDAIRIKVIVECQPQLLQVVPALCAACCFARLLHGGEQQGNQDRDDRDDDQQFNEGESRTRGTGMTHWELHSAGLPEKQSLDNRWQQRNCRGHDIAIESCGRSNSFGNCWLTRRLNLTLSLSRTK
jgi:hypothetical protein